MPRSNLFHPRVIAAQLKTFVFPADLPARHERFQTWVSQAKLGALDAAGERGLHGDFLQRVVSDLLGYRTFSQANEGRWELSSEEGMSEGKSADGALGFFSHPKVRHVVAPIELKGSRQSLDHAGSRALTPVQQGWDYANRSPGSRWIVISNYKETRLYSTLRSPDAYEVFDLESLAGLEGFRRFWMLLSRDTLLPPRWGERSLLDEWLTLSAEVEADVTAKLYKDYRALRGEVLGHLAKKHPNIPALERISLTQTLLDRVLFVAFAEDRGLLPAKTLGDAITTRNRYSPVSVWTNLKAVFRWVDEGCDDPAIKAYDGGLFAPNTALDDLELTDDVCRRLGALGGYDFRDDVSVEVLGHIFEQSIADLEELRAEAAGEEAPKVSKRKSEGVYYTPPYITRFIVERTLGQTLRERFDAAMVRHAPEAIKGKPQQTRGWIAVWEEYRSQLRAIRVLDPACGSGAFLLAAHDLLVRENERVKGALLTLRPGQLEADFSSTTILNENLFGVDLNGESVEITKLSLWLKTASIGRKLTYLDRNVKRGNSVVSDRRLDPNAFSWAQGTQTPRALGEPRDAADEVIDARWREGFDVVIGNPPYVRQERLSRFKEHLEESFRSYHGAADLYVYFYELGLRVLKDGGRLGFVSSGTFARANFAGELRKLLPTIGDVESLVDFGENQPFADAEMVRPSIVVIRKGTRGGPFRYVLLDEKIPESLSDALEKKGVMCPAAALKRPEWSFRSEAAGTIADKLLRGGTPLGDGCWRGILSGFNDAFVVTTSKRDEIVRKDPSSASLIVPLVTGSMLRPWYREKSNDWLIFARRGTDIDAYPGVKAHLEGHREALEPKPRNWPSKKEWKGRKEGSYKWFELQDTVDYHAEFERPKILWPDISKLPRFSLDLGGAYSNDTTFILPTEDRSLLALLQSRALWFAISQICTPLRLRAGLWQYRLKAQFIQRLPIPDRSDDDRAVLGSLAREATDLASDRYALDERHRNRMQRDLLPTSRTLNLKLTDWWRLDLASARDELRRTFDADIPLRDRDDWERLWEQGRAEHEAMTAQIVACEEEINDRVYGLFGLDAAERRAIEDETKYRYGEV